MIGWVIAEVVAVGVIAIGKAMVTSLRMSHRPSHHLAEQTGTEARVPPQPPFSF